MPTEIQKWSNTPCATCGAPRGHVNGEWLRARRVKAGVSLNDMASRLKRSAPYLSDIERNRRMPLAYIVAEYEKL